MADLVMFPHADLHMALHGGAGGGPTPDLTIFVFERRPKPTPDPDDPTLDLVQVTGQCTMEFMAPHNAVGHRFDNLPVFDPSINRITATTPGVYLFELRFMNQALVGRLQVHDRIKAWWFGNQSITTAVHPTLAFSQPSIYASFTSDAGTDPVGDITGCEYVILSSDDRSRVEIHDVFNQGRVRGVKAGETTVRGTFLGTTRSLKVYVENYEALHPDMAEVHVPHVADAEARTNMLFLAEGYQKGDRPTFDQAVTQIVDEMFTKPRHEPYPLVKESINVWKAFPLSPTSGESSRQSHLTCGFQVADRPSSVVQGKPIPEWRYASAGKYKLAELMDRVGLPRSDESRDLTALIGLWSTQGLKDFNATKVDKALADEWKGLKPKSILQAQDTFLGFILGTRLCDRGWTDVSSSQPRGNPPTFNDDNSTGFKEFLDRLYNFYRGVNTTFIGFDPRRTPPEWPRTLFEYYMRSLGTLKSHPNIGDIDQWWLGPEGTTRSRGLLCILANDYMYVRGTNHHTWIAFDLQEKGEIEYDYGAAPDMPIMQRRAIAFSKTNPITTTPITDTLAHEFGHSFGLGDEYEVWDNDEWNSKKKEDFHDDNLTRLGQIFLNAVLNTSTNELTYTNRKIAPAKVKWFALERMQLSDALLEAASTVPGGVKLTIDRCHIAQWKKAKEANWEVFLRETTLNHEQLPLPTGATHFLSGLKIVSIDAAKGTLVVTRSGLPPIGSPVFQTNAVLFVVKRDAANKVLTVVEPDVLAFLLANGTPLNADTDNVHAKVGADDSPVAIPHLSPPLQDYKLIGVYEGAATWAGATYRAAGACKMRYHYLPGDHAQFCHVCKWLIVNRVNPTLHALLDAKLYPISKHVP